MLRILFCLAVSFNALASTVVLDRSLESSVQQIKVSCHSSASVAGRLEQLKMQLDSVVGLPDKTCYHLGALDVLTGHLYSAASRVFNASSNPSYFYVYNPRIFAANMDLRGLVQDSMISYCGFGTRVSDSSDFPRLTRGQSGKLRDYADAATELLTTICQEYSQYQFSFK